MLKTVTCSNCYGSGKTPTRRWNCSHCEGRGTQQISVVEVDGYAYETTLELQVGDKVVVPTAEFLRDVKGWTWVGTVTSLTTTYAGDCKRILRKA